MGERGRPTHMDDQENVELVAEMYANGAQRKDIAGVFGVHVDTVTRWIKRPDVQALVTELRQRRTNRILRKVETAIESRLENEEAVRKMDLKDLLAIMRELRPQRVEVGRAGDFEQRAEIEAWAAIDAGEEVLELEASYEEDDLASG